MTFCIADLKDGDHGRSILATKLHLAFRGLGDTAFCGMKRIFPNGMVKVLGQTDIFVFWGFLGQMAATFVSQSTVVVWKKWLASEKVLFFRKVLWRAPPTVLTLVSQSPTQLSVA